MESIMEQSQLKQHQQIAVEALKKIKRIGFMKLIL